MNEAIGILDTDNFITASSYESFHNEQASLYINTYPQCVLAFPQTPTGYEPPNQSPNAKARNTKATKVHANTAKIMLLLSVYPWLVSFLSFPP
jgi:hypothetical protein